MNGQVLVIQSQVFKFNQVILIKKILTTDYMFSIALQWEDIPIR